MGFREEETVYALTFEGKWEGLVVKVTDSSSGEQLEIERLTGDLVPLLGKKIEEMGPEELAAAIGSNATLIDAFLNHLVEWNVEDAKDGTPVPATREGFARVSSKLGRHVVKTWWEFVSGEISDPLDDGSSSGEPSLVASLPMEPLSPNHESSSEPSSSSAAANGSGASLAS